jgi:hypothetical protein
MNKRWAMLLGLAAAGAAAVAVLAIAGPLASIAAEPGGKDDPLATVGCRALAQYNSLALPAGQSLRVGTGAEFVIVDAEDSALATTEFEPLRQTARSERGRASACRGAEGLPPLPQRQQPASSALRSETTLMIRGSWK